MRAGTLFAFLRLPLSLRLCSNLPLSKIYAADGLLFFFARGQANFSEIYAVKAQVWKDGLVKRGVKFKKIATQILV